MKTGRGGNFEDLESFKNIVGLHAPSSQVVVKRDGG